MQTELKKSAVDLTELALGIVVLGIIVAVGATIVMNFRDAQVTNLPTYVIANETVTTVTNTGESLTYGWVKSIDYVRNATDASLIQSGNYSLTVNGEGFGTIKSITSTATNNTDWNVTYTVYNKSDPRFSIPQNATIGLQEYGNWFKILVIVGIAAVILGLIFMAFGKRGVLGGDGGANVNY